MPSASGKTNLAMMVSALPGWRVWTVGDDIAWIHVDAVGQLRAINPERGFFGVAPNTSVKTNPNATTMVRANTIFTNVALTSDGEPWWEGMGTDPPPGLVDWQGTPQSPSVAPAWEDPQGLPISGFIFGSRRSRVIPLVFEAFDWQHGVFLGSAMSTETTAAITGQVGMVRRDPMAMIPFCGYNMADYFSHWLSIGTRLAAPPTIFRVNRFRRGGDRTFLLPGYGDNARVLQWIVERIRGTGKAVETPLGFIPTPDAMDLSGLSLPRERLAPALAWDRAEWLEALGDLGKFYEEFGGRLPGPIREELSGMIRRLGG